MGDGKVERIEGLQAVFSAEFPDQVRRLAVVPIIHCNEADLVGMQVVLKGVPDKRFLMFRQFPGPDPS